MYNDYIDCHPSWNGLVAAWGFEVLSFEYCGDYQGDILVLLRDGDRLGFTAIGYGSCGGCDALESCRTPEEVAELDASVRDQVRWFATPAELFAFLDSDTIRGNWYWHDEEIREVLLTYRDLVA